MSKKKKAVAEKQPVINESYELVATDRLLPHPRNVNRGDMIAIGSSIAENGFYGAVVAQKSTGHILAGNHRYDAAKAAGIAEVPVTWVDVDDDRALRILLADNRTTRLGHDDQEALAALLQEILADTETLAGTGFDEIALDELLAEVGVTECESEGLTDDDAVPEPLAFPVTEPGDLWVLGKHRLLCGDSTSIDAVQRLMDGCEADICFTSPPYGQQRNYETGISDWLQLMKDVFGILPVSDAAQVLVNLGLIHKDGEWIPYWEGWLQYMRESGWRRFGWYVWDQGPGLPGDWNGRLAPSHEFVFHLNRQSKKANKTVECKWAGEANHGSGLRAKDGTVTGYSHVGRSVQDKKIADSVIRVMRHKARGIECEHPAVFPVELVENLLDSFSQAGDIAYEPFSGSGTQILAAEKLSRQCRAMEIAPNYCDIAIKRWQDFTGKEAVLESDGRTFNEISAERKPAAAVA